MARSSHQLVYQSLGGAEEFDAVVDAAQHGEMAEVAAKVIDGEIYRKDDLILTDGEIVELRKLLRSRWLGLFDEGQWWLISAIRECPTCAAELVADEQCERCIGPVGELS